MKRNSSGGKGAAGGIPSTTSTTTTTNYNNTKSNPAAAAASNPNAFGSGGLPRKVTAVGTLGEVGAAYSVYEKNWVCADCQNENYARRTKCHRCRAPKPANTKNLIVKGTEQVSKWREAIDPTSNQIYYYHTETLESRWDRPEEMGAAPHGTGWFGRGAAGMAQKYEENNARYLSRPAKKQIDEIPTKNSLMEGATEYNIWYNRHVNENFRNDRLTREAAENRCDIEKDAGWTKADKISKTNRYFCLHFARGQCCYGQDCLYFHRIPTRMDETTMGMMHDCFGRQRHATDKDDMSGVGSFTRNSRTLYVGGLVNANQGAKKLEAALWKHFGEWGEVENINVIHRLSICFIRYRFRTNAEFAKEAMTNQALDDNEVLNIRWAFDDPNSVAKDSNARADHDAIVATLQARGVSTEQAAYEYPESYQMPETKRARIEGDVISSYPDTDTQYKQATLLLSYAEEGSEHDNA